MAAYALLGFLTLLCILNVMISIPLDKPADIGKDGIDESQTFLHKWYYLLAGNYLVDSSLGVSYIRSSFLPFASKQYTYYSVTVNPGEENAFQMAVRVRSAKAVKMEGGEAVTLYGMLSGIGEDIRAGLEDSAAGQVCVKQLCLNDNGDTVFKRWLSAAAFAVLAGVCICLIVIIAAKKR